MELEDYIDNALGVLETLDGIFDDEIEAHIEVGVDSENENQLVLTMHYEEATTNFLVSVTPVKEPGSKKISSIFRNSQGATIVFNDDTVLTLDEDDMNILAYAFEGECEACGFDPTEADR